MRTAAAALALFLALPAAAQPKPRTDLEKTLYAVGVAAADSFRTFDLTPAELEMAQRGLRDALTGKPVLVDMAAYRSKVDALAAERRAALERKLTARYAAKAGAARDPSGLVFVPLAPGTGPIPTATDVVKVDYAGTFADGTVFDATARKGEPAVIPLERAIRCWREALPKMKVGARAQLACPPALAYGATGLPGVIPPDATLFFDIELLSIPARIVVGEGPVPETKGAEGASGPPPPAPAPAGSPGPPAAPAERK